MEFYGISLGSRISGSSNRQDSLFEGVDIGPFLLSAESEGVLKLFVGYFPFGLLLCFSEDEVDVGGSALMSMTLQSFANLAKVLPSMVLLVPIKLLNTV
jgi:hypothetical protein